MYSVDRLNRQYEKLREAVEEPENVGPLESSVKSLQKEITAVSLAHGPHTYTRGVPWYICSGVCSLVWIAVAIGLLPAYIFE